eukprot:9490984-Pyramimonas_sp.AAC.1
MAQTRKGFRMLDELACPAKCKIAGNGYQRSRQATRGGRQGVRGSPSGGGGYEWAWQARPHCHPSMAPAQGRGPIETLNNSWPHQWHP